MIYDTIQNACSISYEIWFAYVLIISIWIDESTISDFLIKIRNKGESKILDMPHLAWRP